MFNFIYDFKADAICKSGNLKALEYMLLSLNQIEKDSILYVNLHTEEIEDECNIDNESKQMKIRDRTTEEIERIPCFKIIINSDANCLYRCRPNSNSWNNEVFKHIEGEIVELEEKNYDKHSFSYFGGRNFIPVISNWKEYSYQEYLAFISQLTD